MLDGPVGPMRGDIQAAIVASTVANAFSGKKGKAATPADFLPKWEDASGTAPTEDELRAKAFAAFGKLGGVVKQDAP